MPDLGNRLAGALLEAAQDAITAANLEMPGQIMQVGGIGTPVVDPCDGLLWVRMAGVMPGDGSANQFTEARIGWSIPGWVYSIELGCLFCHPTIDAGGNAPDPDEWASAAVRDGEYRSALHDAVAYRFPPMVSACAGGQRIDPWAPIGPDDGFSGGLLVAHVVANFLQTGDPDPCL